ncbi:MAG: tRNA pseudouridine(38-40) synthase TruA, partial [Ilumatobacteraceae bacterium]
MAYLGSAFRGAAENPGVRTVVGELRAAICRVVGHDVEITLAGRTDAGVHATGQVITLDLPEVIDLDDLVHRVNRMCAPDISLREPARVDPRFDARFSATSRRYRYSIHNAPSADPLTAGLRWHVPVTLDIPSMREAADTLLGEHDFSSFRAAECQAEHAVRTLYRLDVSRHGDEVQLLVEANAFLHHMVRNIVGTLAVVGRGEAEPGWVSEVLAGRDRRAAG